MSLDGHLWIISGKGVPHVPLQASKLL